MCYTDEPGKVEDVRYIPLDRIPVRALPRGYGPQIGVTVIEDRQEMCCFNTIAFPNCSRFGKQHHTQTVFVYVHTPCKFTAGLLVALQQHKLLSCFAGKLTRPNCLHSRPNGAPVFLVSNVARTRTLWQQAQQQKQRCYLSDTIKMLQMVLALHTAVHAAHQRGLCKCLISTHMTLDPLTLV